MQWLIRTNAHLRFFFAREFEVPMGAYLGEYVFSIYLDSCNAGVITLP